MERIEAMKTKLIKTPRLTPPVPDRFTDAWLARARIAPGVNAREVEAVEPCGSGLGVRVRANGGKSLIVDKQKDGRTMRRTLGGWPHLTLANARKALEVLIGEMARGVDVNKEHKDRLAKARAPKPATLAELTDRWERERLAQQRNSYRERATASVRYTFKPMMRTPAVDLTGEAIEAVLDEAIARGQAAARMAGVSLRTLLRWAVSKRAIVTAPTFTLPAKTAERERVLSEDDLRRLYQAAGMLLGLRGKLFRLVMLLGLRRSEVGELRWSEVHHLDDPALAEIRLPSSRTKTGAGHWVPLSAEARRILLSVPRIEGETFVFPGAKGGTHFDDWHRLKQELDAAAGEPALASWVIHDLRRSLVTILAGRPYSLSPTILDKLLGHAPSALKGAAKIYQRQEYPQERREALETWARVLTARAGKGTAL
jgi:integrase